MKVKRIKTVLGEKYRKEDTSEMLATIGFGLIMIGLFMLCIYFGIELL